MTKIKGIRKWAQNIDRNKEDAPPAVLMHFIKLASGKEKEKKREKRGEREDASNDHRYQKRRDQEPEGVL